MSNGIKNSGDGAGEDKPFRRQGKGTRKVIHVLKSAADKCREDYESGTEAERFYIFVKDFLDQDLDSMAQLERLLTIIYAKNPMTCNECQGTEFIREKGERIGQCTNCKLRKWVTAGTAFSHVKEPVFTNAMLGLFQAGIIFNPYQFSRSFNCSYDTAHGLFAKIQRIIAEELQKEEEIASLSTRALVDVTTRRSWDTPAQACAQTEQDAAEREMAESASSKEEIVERQTVEQESSEGEIATEENAEAPFASDFCQESLSEDANLHNFDVSIKQEEEEPSFDQVNSQKLEQNIESKYEPNSTENAEGNGAPLDFLRDEAAKIMQVLQVSPEALAFDVLLERCSLSCSILSSALTILEIEGSICSVPGGRFALKQSDIAFNALRYCGDKSENPARRMAKWDAQATPGWPLPKFLERFANSLSQLIKTVHQGVSRKRLHLYTAMYLQIFRARRLGVAMPLGELFASNNWGSRDDLRKLKCPLAVNVYGLT